MAKSHETTIRVAASPDRLVEVLISDDYHVARDTVQGAITVEVKGRSRDGARLVYEVHSTRYARGLTGVDRSKTEASVATYTWDLDARAATWVHRGPHDERAQVNGTIAIEPDGDGSLLHDALHVTIKVPLIGGKIESLVVSELKKGFEKYVSVVRDHAER